MSFSFAGGKATIGQRSSALTSVNAVTLGFFYKVTVYTFAYIVGFSDTGNISGDYSDQYLVYVLDNGGDPYLLTRNSDSAAGMADTGDAFLNQVDTWVGVIASLTNNGSRQVWQKPWGGSIQTAGSVSTNPKTTNTSLDWMHVGQASGNNGNQYFGKLADVAVWTSILSQTDREAYLSGTSADQVSPSTLQGYWYKKDQTTRTNNYGATWPLSTDSNGGASAAVYDSDHPAITYLSGATGLTRTTVKLGAGQ